MIISSIEYVPGKEIESLGHVIGSTVMSKHIGRDIAAALKSVVGGEIKGYTEMLREAQSLVVKRIQEEAAKLGADAIVGMHFTSISWQDGSTGLIAYGTAVKFLV